MKKRISQIEEMLHKYEKVSVAELSELFEVSAVSIRKDLALLEKKGIARRFYGGATLAGMGEKLLVSGTDFYQDSVRQRLAEQACSEIGDGDCLFLGSGRTCCILARKLDRFQRLTVVTNNITALQDLLKRVSKVYLIGGEVTSTDGMTLFSSWEQPQPFAEKIYVNKAITSISGIDIKAGLTVNSIISTYVFRHIPTMAHQWIVLADYTKYNKIAMYPVAALRQISAFISDEFPQAYQQFFQQHHIRMVHTAKTDPAAMAIESIT